MGFASGKAREVPTAISKGVERAKRNLCFIPLQGSTIPHAVVGRFGSGQVYAGSLLAWGLTIPMIAALKFHSTGAANRTRGVLGNIAEGLSYTRRDATIFAVISIVVITQFIGMPGPSALGPVWMTKVLGLSKAQFGLSLR